MQGLHFRKTERHFHKKSGTKPEQDKNFWSLRAKGSASSPGSTPQGGEWYNAWKEICSCGSQLNCSMPRHTLQVWLLRLVSMLLYQFVIFHRMVEQRKLCLFFFFPFLPNHSEGSLPDKRDLYPANKTKYPLYSHWGPLYIIFTVQGAETYENIIFYFAADFKGNMSPKIWKNILKWKKMDKHKLASRDISRKQLSTGPNTCTPSPTSKQTSNSVLPVV